MENMDSTKLYIVDAFVDDYESLETVFEEVEGQAADAGSQVSREAVVRALEELISEGYIRCYSFSSSSGVFSPADFARSPADDLWFYVTEKGKKFVTNLP